MAAEAEAQVHSRPQRQAQKKRPEPAGEEERTALPRQLRRLEFARLAAARAVVYLAGLYYLAKSRAGPLCPAVDAVESAVARAVVPLYDRFRDAPLALLVFLDRKVDDTVQRLDRKLLRSLKAAPSQACTAAREVPRVAREVLAEARRSGVAGAGRAAYVKMEPTAKCLYLRYGPTVGCLAVSTWRSLNRLPLFPQVAQIAVPTAAHWAERYNGAIAAAASRGCAGARCLPPIPTKLIARFFSDRGVEVDAK